MSGKTHLIADESIGGVQREYVEVERQADVGDYVVITQLNHEKANEIRRVIETAHDIQQIEFTPRVGDEDIVDYELGDTYKTLEPTDIVHIEGKRYRLVDSKAEVGEKVLAIHTGEVLSVKSVLSQFIRVYEPEEYTDQTRLNHENYRVLEPVADAIIANKSEPTVDARHASPEVVDLLANLARRVTSLESQLRDTQGNVEKLSEELEAVRYGNDELYGRLAHVEDERTQLQTVNITVNMPELPGDDVAKCVSEMLKRLATNGSERP
ncbi:hypothetical protein [Robertmurraya sp. DFI.2.37]|nr:hypothetical protein [Robertmurraya sp. DFI.2.37]